MDKNLEFLTKRKIKVNLITDVGLPNEEYQKSSEEKIKEWLNNRTK